MFGDIERVHVLRELGNVGELEVFRRKGCWLRKYIGEMELVGDLVEFMGYSCAGKGNKESTIVHKLVAISFYHEQLLGPSVPMSKG